MNWFKKNINGILITLSVVCIVFSIFSPFIFTRSNECGIDFSKTGEIGDTIGGLTSPFIGVAAVFITGLAFYAQYNANKIQINALKEQKKQFEEEQKKYHKNTNLQKFETRFYEMLRLHKENVNEIEVETTDGKTIKGRNAFLEMKKDLENLFLFKSLKKLEEDEKKYSNLENLFLFKNLERLEKDEKKYRICYHIFFWGLGNNIMKDSKEKDLKEFFKNVDEYTKSTEKENFFHFTKAPSKLRIRKLEGHHSYLGHYYRHLFLTVKFVVNQKEDLISEEEKLNYLRILRAQLSNYEQIMLFYNWLSSYGGDWESNENQFFTKYKMIHNLWHREMYKDDFIKGKLKKLVGKYKLNGGKGEFFEIGDDIEDTENK